MSHGVRRSSLSLMALLSLTTSLTSIAGVALAESVPTRAAAPAPVALMAVPPSPAAVRTAAPKPKPVRKHVVARPTPSPTAKPRVHHAAPKPVATTATHSASPKPTATRTATRTATTSLTPQQRMMRAVARIPGYRTGDAVWVMRRQSNWGLALMGGGTVYISTTVPADRMYDVVSHEWSHLLSVRDYGNNVQDALDAMNAYFGGSGGLAGAEVAADCMAKVLGATWTHYTPCSNSHWIAGAKRLLAGQKV